MVERVVVELNFLGAEAADGIFDGLPDDVFDVFVVERLQLEDARTRHKCPVHREIRIFRGRADENDGAVFDPWQEGVLLRFVPAVDFIDEEDGPLALFAEAGLGGGRDVPQVRDAGHDGVQRDELAFRRVGDDAGERRLACSGRPVEDERRQLIRLDGAS